MNLDQIIEIVQSISGWWELGDIRAMYDLLQGYKSSINFLELGSWKGRSTTSIALSLPLKSTLFCVDTFEGSSNELETSHKEAVENPESIYQEFLSNVEKIKSYRPDLDIRVFKRKTNDAVKYFENEFFDIILIDANHLFQFVLQDFTNYFCKVKPEGLIVGHDAHQGCPGIIKFLTAVLDRRKLISFANYQSSMWAIPKKDVDLKLMEQLRKRVNNE